MKTATHTAADRFDGRPFANQPRRRNVRRPRQTPFGLSRAELVAAALALVFAAAPAIAAVLYFAANLGNR